MKYSPSAKLIAGALLAATLSAKLIASETPAKPDPKVLAAHLTGLLGKSGYASRSELRPLGMAVYGSKGGCAVMVREYSVHGTHANALKELALPYGPLRFVFRGEISVTAPKAFPLTEFYVRRELARIGIATPRAPILAVAAKPACNIESIPWAQVATLAD